MLAYFRAMGSAQAFEVWLQNAPRQRSTDEW